MLRLRVELLLLYESRNYLDTEWVEEVRPYKCAM